MRALGMRVTSGSASLNDIDRQTNQDSTDMKPERRQYRSDTELRKQREQLRRDWESRADHDATDNRRTAVPKASRSRSDNVVTIPSVSPMEMVTDTDIARRAYALFEERGFEHGHDVDDWLRAERELIAAFRSTAA